MKSTATKFSALAFAASLLLGVSATAQTMSYSDYRSGKSKIKADYKVEKRVGGCFHSHQTLTGLRFICFSGL